MHFDLVSLGWDPSSAFLTRPQMIPKLPFHWPNFKKQGLAELPGVMLGGRILVGHLRPQTLLSSYWLFTAAGDIVTPLLSVMYKLVK